MRKVALSAVLAAALLAIPAQSQQVDDPIAVLQSDAPYAEKAEACRILQRHGQEEAIPALAALLTDEEMSHMARYALQPMPYPEAGAALRAALDETTGVLRVGVIDSLGARRDEEAVPALANLLNEGAPRVQEAAARALGKIATPKAARALQQGLQRENLEQHQVEALSEALLIAADQMYEEGQAQAAQALYANLLELENAAAPVEAGAMRGAIVAGGGVDAMSRLTKALRSEEDHLFDAALGAAREIQDAPNLSSTLAGELDQLEPARQVRVIQLLGQVGDDAAGSALLDAAQDGPEEVRVAAIKALTRIGHAPALDVIASLSRSEDAAVAEAAQNALMYFPEGQGDAAIIEMLKSEDQQQRLQALDLIARGGLAQPVVVLIETASADADSQVRTEALKSLRNFVGTQELPALLDRLEEAETAEERAAAERAIDAVITRALTPGQADIQIEEAAYGDLAQGPSADVTDKVASLIEGGATSIDATNATFGDAAPGKRKQLRVVYSRDGGRVSETVQEGEALKLITASAPADLVSAISGALDDASGDTQLALLRLLGATGSPEALDTVQKAATEGEGAVKDAALQALFAWPNDAPLSTAMDMAVNAEDAGIRGQALRSAVRMLQQSGDEQQALEGYARLLENARSADDKKLVLSGLAQASSPEAFEMALRQMQDEAVKAEAQQAAVAIGKRLGSDAQVEEKLKQVSSLDGWVSDKSLWRVEEGAVVGQSTEPLDANEFAWVPAEVSDFYLVADVKLEPDTGNAGVQFRSKNINERNQASGYQADMGQNVWGRLYHEQGRGKLDWTGTAESGVKPGEWNRLEILAIGPAIWTAINGQPGVAFLDLEAQDEETGGLSFQLHAGPPMQASYRIVELVHNPKVEMQGQSAEQLIPRLNPNPPKD